MPVGWQDWADSVLALAIEVQAMTLLGLGRARRLGAALVERGLGR